MLTVGKCAWFVGLLAELPSFPLFLAYLAVVFLSPLYVRFTKPWNASKIILISYNAFCCLLSSVALLLFARAYALEPYASIFDTKPGRLGGDLRRAFSLYHVSKAVELLDTVVIVARHRVRQLSFLHVYHHASMLLLSNLASARYPWIGIGFYLALNSIVHVVLYFYYAVAAYKPDASLLTWKRRLTQAQIAQFLLGFVYSSYGCLHHGYCIYGPAYGATLTALFCNFYFRAYCGGRRNAVSRGAEKLE